MKLSQSAHIKKLNRSARLRKRWDVKYGERRVIPEEEKQLKEERRVDFTSLSEVECS